LHNFERKDTHYFRFIQIHWKLFAKIKQKTVLNLRKHAVARQNALSKRGIPFLGQDWLYSCRRMTIFGQDWSCANRRKYSVDRQSALSCRSIPFLGQDWLCSHRRKHSVARQRALSYRSIPFLGQDWLCSYRRMTIFGQDWLCANRRKHSVGRQSALSCRSIPFLGQDWLYLDLKRNICRLSLPIRRNNPIIYHQDLHFFGKKTAFRKKDIIFAF